MATREQLQSDLKAAMRAGADVRKSTLRMILAAVKLAEVDRRGPLDEAALETVLQKEAKTRREATSDAQKAGRPDLAGAEQAQLAVIEAYLPRQLSREEIRALVQAAIARTGAAGPGAMGQVMKVVGPQTRGLADGKLVSEIVRQALAGG